MIHKISKKNIILSILVTGILIFLFGTVYIQLFRRKDVAIAIPKAVENVKFSIYEGTFLSWKDNYLRVKLSNGGLVAGFVTDEKTIVMRSRFKDATRTEEKKSFADVPSAAKTLIEVINIGEDKTYKATKVIYDDSSL